jgi:hypothetical protein
MFSKIIKSKNRIVLFVSVIFISISFIQDDLTFNVEAGTVTMTDKKTHWEGTHNVTQVLQFNATDTDPHHTLTWWIHTNSTCLGLEQTPNGESAWINGTPDYNETEQSFSVYIGVTDNQGYDDTNEFIMYINNSAPILENPMDNIIIAEGTEINHQYTCIDQNDDHVNFTVEGDDHLHIDENGHLHGTPSNHDGVVVVVVSDGMDDDSDSFNFRVTGGGSGEEVISQGIPMWVIIVLIIGAVLIYFLFFKRR